jgi:uncharacterized membrane protein YdjX (TVP38/TMEM64 family)/Fe-S oxidoreductase
LEAEAKMSPKDFSGLDVREGLRQELEAVSSTCINCKLCKKECMFLSTYGKPKEIADNYDPDTSQGWEMPFECSLCGLCAAVCPVSVDPSAMFLQMRAEAVDRGKAPFPEHGGLIAYERRGISKKYSYYALPEGCSRILFPGCTLPGTRPRQTLDLFERLRRWDPTLGIVLDCCTKISHDLGRKSFFKSAFEEMRDYLVKRGVHEVLVACPNCYKIFRTHGQDLKARSVYEILAEVPLHRGNGGGVASVHDSCGVRKEEQVHAAVRKLSKNLGMDLVEMKHSGVKTLCCGEGGSVGRINPSLSERWGEIRKSESEGRLLITSCAGCGGFLNAKTPTTHVLDLLYDPKSAVKGKAKVSKPPLTYFNRLRLKKGLKKNVAASVTRERDLPAEQTANKASLIKRLLLLAAVIGGIVAIRVSGATEYLDQEKLRAAIQGYGVLAPIVYMLLYTIAPVLFLPGLPITIAGGILFGPFWGVVYTITGATAEACVAFLTARYLARDWIEVKLRSPRWKRLDQGVEREEWKIVAFTRLIPVFLFNLLNYAFGLTRIKFLQYAVTTLVCMLPACIAFITFSSSLLDLVQGKVSREFLIGLGLVVFVSLIPLFYKVLKRKKGKEDPV